MQHKNIIIIVFLTALFFALIEANGQRIINVGLHAGPCLSSINTSFQNSTKDVKSKGSFNLNFKLSGKYFLTDRIGVASGFEMLSFKQASSVISTYESFNTLYVENQYYERRVWGDSITEDVTLRVLHVPLQIFYHHKFNNAFAVYGSLGPGINISISSKCNGVGTFTYKGYFPEEKALLWDIPMYGLSSDVNIETKNKPQTNLLFINVAASAGVELSINRYYRFNAALGYYRTLTNAFKTGKSIHISDQIGSYNSVLGSSKNNLTNISVSLGITKNILF